MMLNKIFAVLLILIISSCELTDSDAGVVAKQGPSDPVIEDDFSIELTPEGILKEKFSEANLVCLLWFQKGETLNEDINLAKTFNWDLINNFSLENEFNLTEKIDALGEATVVAKINAFDILTNLVNEDGDQFRMSYNPLISMKFNYITSEKLSSDVNINNQGQAERNFKHNEKPEVVINNKRTLEGDVNAIFTYLKCEFKTTAISPNTES